MKKTKLIFTAFFFLAILFKANSQISIDNVQEISNLKGATTYIAMKDPNSEKAKEYVEIFKRYWNLSKFEFIKYSEIDKYLAPGNFFFTIGGYVTNVSSITLFKTGSKSGLNYSNTHIYLELWKANDKYFEAKKKKDFDDQKHKIQIARIELFTDFKTLMEPKNLYSSEYDGNGHIRNWGPGILKNYLQSLNSFINKGEKKSLFSEIVNTSELKKLATENLYVPDYLLTKFNKFSGDETKKHTEKDIFEDYKLKYQILSTENLNQKILAETSPFYYLIYIKSSTDKYISVINSLTGEYVYSVYTPVSYNIKSGDLKDLQKKIQKN